MVLNFVEEKNDITLKNNCTHSSTALQDLFDHFHKGIWKFKYVPNLDVILFRHLVFQSTGPNCLLFCTGKS